MKINKSSFCISPWIHMHTWPNGDVYPCCMTPFDEPFGNLGESTLQEIWNNEKMKQLRREMLNGEYPNSCRQCYEFDGINSSSLRTDLNSRFFASNEMINNTAEDGSLNSFTPLYWDFRFSNQCNMKCRTCGAGLSSSWFDDEIKLYNSSAGKRFVHTENLWEQVKGQIDSLEEIYFAGGEPLLMKEHHLILEELVARKAFHVRLRYNTNFMITSIHGEDIFEVWKMFKSVEVAASLDATSRQGEYIRSGSSWEKIVANRKKMLKIAPEVDFFISSTLSILNAFALPELHRDWIEQELIAPDKFNINYVLHPEHYRVNILPQNIKERLLRKYHEHIAYLERKGVIANGVIKYFHSAIEFIQGQGNKKALKEFTLITRKLDGIRKENILDSIPELRDLFYE